VPTEFVIDVHGETYRVDITGVGVKAEGKRHFYLSIDGMPEEVVFEPLNEFVGGGSSKRKQATDRATSAPPCRATSSMCWSRKVTWSRPARRC
jgi:pyruvate carboxylase subunit B